MEQFNDLYNENQQKINPNAETNLENSTNLQDFNDKSVKKGKSFYIALFVCLTAVFAAGWSTYVSVKDFLGTNDSPENSSIKSSAQIGNFNKPKSNSTPSESIKDEILKETPNLKPVDTTDLFKTKPQTETLSIPDTIEETRPTSSNKIQNLKIVYPVSNVITKEFSDGKPVHSKTFNDWRIHDGTDLKAEIGSPVKSISGGVVQDVYKDEIYGYTIVINHDSNFVAYYCGLDEKISLKKNDRVEADQKIANIGTVPSEILDDPHLHLIIKKEGKSIDPILILEKIDESE